MEAIQERRNREDQLCARFGYFVYTAQGVKMKGGRQPKERDFMPQPPPSEKQLAMMHEIECMKIDAVNKRKAESNGE